MPVGCQARDPIAEDLLHMRVVIFLTVVTMGAILIWHDLRFFALYAFTVVVGMVMWGLDQLWKLQRVSHFSNAGKILAVARRVGVTSEDFDAVAKEMRSSESSDRVEELIRDYRNLQS